MSHSFRKKADRRFSLYRIVAFTALGVSVCLVAFASFHAIGVPEFALITCTMGLAGLLLVHKNNLSIYCVVAAMVAWLPLPTVVPTSFSAGGGTLFISDIAVLLVGILIIGRVGVLARPIILGLAGIGFVFISAALLGLLKGASITDVSSDVRGLVYTVIMGLGIALALIQDHDHSRRLFLQACSFISLYSGLVVAIELFFNTRFFSMRADAAVLYTVAGTTETEAVRLVPTSGLFCVVFAGLLLGLWFSGHIRTRTYPWLWPVVISGLFVASQSYSRNNLLVLAVIVLVVVMFNVRITNLMRIVSGTSLIVVLAASAWHLVAAMSPTLKRIVEESINAFSERVLGGLRPETVSEDYSSQWRVTESAAGLKSVVENPLGTGFGIPYRGWLPGDPWGTDYGYTYLHNSYLWFPVKTGLFGTFVVTLALTGLIILVLRAKSTLPRSVTSSIGSLGIGLAVVMVVSPLPFSRSGGILCGALVGFTLWAVNRAGISNTARARDRVPSIPLESAEYRI